MRLSALFTWGGPLSLSPVGPDYFRGFLFLRFSFQLPNGPDPLIFPNTRTAFEYVLTDLQERFSSGAPLGRFLLGVPRDGTKLN